MISCKEVARLVSEGLDRELPLRRRIGLRFHLMMCSACARYRRQIEALERIIVRHFSGTAPPALADRHRLPPDARERIKDTIRKNIRKNLRKNLRKNTE